LGPFSFDDLLAATGRFLRERRKATRILAELEEAPLDLVHLAAFRGRKFLRFGTGSDTAPGRLRMTELSGSSSDPVVEKINGHGELQPTELS